MKSVRLRWHYEAFTLLVVSLLNLHRSRLMSVCPITLLGSNKSVSAMVYARECQERADHCPLRLTGTVTAYKYAAQVLLLKCLRVSVWQRLRVKYKRNRPTHDCKSRRYCGVLSEATNTWHTDNDYTYTLVYILLEQPIPNITEALPVTERSRLGFTSWQVPGNSIVCAAVEQAQSNIRG